MVVVVGGAGRGCVVAAGIGASHDGAAVAAAAVGVQNGG